MSHNATHTMDKEHGATASSLWTILAAVALPLIFQQLLEQSQSALVNYVNAWGNWLAGLVDGEQVSRVVERVEVFDRNGYDAAEAAPTTRTATRSSSRPSSPTRRRIPSRAN